MIFKLPVIAIMKETVAAKRRILTRRSSKDSLILSQREVSSSFSKVFSPYYLILSSASSVVRPFFKFVFKSSITFSKVLLWYVKSVISSDYIALDDALSLFSLPFSIYLRSIETS
jgi:hypothetical protein